MPVWQAIFIFLVAFGTTYAMVPVSKRIAIAIGAIDYPGPRRVNKDVMARAGGIALYTGFVVAALVLYAGKHYLGWEFNDLYSVSGVDYVLLFCGLTIVFLVGLIDDVSPLSPRSKLAGQIVAAVVICLSGVTIGSLRWVFTGEYIALGWMDFPVTIVYFLIFMNAINLIDGLDGLAAGIVAIDALALLYLVLVRGNITFAFICLIIIAVCLAFLRFNFHPAQFFMGDSGSLFLGTLIAIISITCVMRSQGIAIFIVPLVIAGVPVIDTGSAIIRRLREGKRIDEADMEHMHHRIMASGYSQRRTVLVLYALTAVLAFAGCFIGSFAGFRRWVALGILIIGVFILIYRLRLFAPVLQHHYRRREKVEPRRDLNNPL